MMVPAAPPPLQCWLRLRLSAETAPGTFVSLYHLNQYQTNTGVGGGFLNGGPLNDPLPGDEEFDRSNLGVVHGTVDDNAIILNLLKTRLLQKVTR